MSAQTQNKYEQTNLNLFNSQDNFVLSSKKNKVKSIKINKANSLDSLFDSTPIFKVNPNATSYISKTLTTIIKDGEYDEAKILTYSLTPSLLCKNIENFNFKKVEAIIGLAYQDLNEQIQKYFSDEEEEKEWSNLKKDDIKTKIANNEINLYYPLDFINHDKVYLLKNNITNNTLVITGSANLSKTALDKKSKQTEHLEIRENDEYFYNFWLSRFNLLKEKSTPCFSERRKEYYRNNKKDFVILKQSSEEERINISEDKIKKLFDVAPDLIDKVMDNKHNSEFVKIVTEEIKLETIKKNDKYIFDKNESIKNKTKRREIIRKIYNFNTISNKDNNNSLDNRPGLYLKKENGKYNIYYEPLFNNPDKLAENISTLSYTKEELRKELLNIEAFMNTYNQFNLPLKFKQRNMDIIMSCFQMPFAKEIRELLGNDLKKIHVFSILVGRSNLGKTQLINMISKLIGVNQEGIFLEPNPSKSFYNNISNYLMVKGNDINRMPLLIDDVRNFGNPMTNFIKSIDNNHNTAVGFILSANIDGFSLPYEVSNRSIQFIYNEGADLSSGDNSNLPIIEQTNNLLFKIYLKKMLNILNLDNNNKYFNIDSFSSDSICITRSIFKDLYIEADLPKPDFLVDNFTNDYIVEGKRMWKDLLYSISKPLNSRTIPESNQTVIYIEQNLFDNQKQYQYYMQYLPSDIVYNSSKNQKVIVLDREKFFDWLGTRDFNYIDINKTINNNQNKSLFQRLFKKY